MTTPTPHYTLNGEKHPLGSGLTIPLLLTHHGYTQTRVAIELNGHILPRSAWADYELQADDKLEIVHFVGGG